MVATSDPHTLLKQDSRFLRCGFGFGFCVKLLVFKKWFYPYVDCVLARQRGLYLIRGLLVIATIAP